MFRFFLIAPLAVSTLIGDWALNYRLLADQTSGTLHLIAASHPQADFISLDYDSQTARFQYGQSEHSIALEAILAWRSNRRSLAIDSDSVILTDGSVLRGLMVGLNSNQVQIQTALFGLSKVPTSLVAGVTLRSKQSKVEEFYSLWLSPTAQVDDTVYLQDGKLAKGTLADFGKSSALMLEPTQTLQLKAGEASQRFSIARVAAIRFSPALNPMNIPRSSYVELLFDDLTHLHVQDIDNIGLLPSELTLANGLKLSNRQLESLWSRCVAVRMMGKKSERCEPVGASQLLDIRGQSSWSRTNFVYSQRNFFTPYPSSIDVAQPQELIIGVPSFRAKIANPNSLARLVGTVAVQPPPSRASVVADVLGSSAPTADPLAIEPSPQVRFIAVSKGAIVELQTISSNKISQVPLAFSVDIGQYPEVYVVVESEPSSTIQSAVVFDHLRLAQ